jgi:hypothetical protein
VRSLVLIALLILSVSPVIPVNGVSQSQASQWTQFRGQAGRGAAADKVPYPVKLDPEASMLWATEMPSGHSSPVIFEERVFATGHTDGALEVPVLTVRVVPCFGEVKYRA